MLCNNGTGRSAQNIELTIAQRGHNQVDIRRRFHIVERRKIDPFFHKTIVGSAHSRQQDLVRFFTPDILTQHTRLRLKHFVTDKGRFRIAQSAQFDDNHIALCQKRLPHGTRHQGDKQVQI